MGEQAGETKAIPRLAPDPTESGFLKTQCVGVRLRVNNAYND